MSNNVDKSIKKRLDELRIDVLFSKKGHYNAAAIWNWVHYILGVSTTALAAFIGVKNSALPKETLAVLAMGTAALGAIFTFLKPQEKAAQHKQSGDDFDNLLQLILNFSEVEMLLGNDNDHAIELNTLTEQKTKLNKSSLQIPRLAYKRAQKGVRKGEADYVEKA